MLIFRISGTPMRYVLHFTQCFQEYVPSHDPAEVRGHLTTLDHHEPLECTQRHHWSMNFSGVPYPIKVSVIVSVSFPY